MQNARKVSEVGMRELIIKVDDPGERAWDGSSKVFEIKELVRCKDCKYAFQHWNDFYRCDNHNELTIGYGDHKGNWFCADGERKSD